MVRLTSRQLSEWEAYDTIDPIGTWRDDYRASYLATILTNIAIRTHGKRGANLVTVKDFILDWDGSLKEAKEIQSLEQMKASLMQIVQVHNKTIGKRAPKKKLSIKTKPKDEKQ